MDAGDREEVWDYLETLQSRPIISDRRRQKSACAFCGCELGHKFDHFNNHTKKCRFRRLYDFHEGK